MQCSKKIHLKTSKASFQLPLVSILLLPGMAAVQALRNNTASAVVKFQVKVITKFCAENHDKNEENQLEIRAQ